MKQIFFTVVLFIAFSLPLIAQAPEKMTYQAVVRDGDSELVTNSQIDVRVRILQGNPNGNSVYVEDHSPITNENGLFTITIGDGIVLSGDFNGIEWGNGSYYQETNVDMDMDGNSDITLVSQFMSVPYALYAKEAGPWLTNGDNVYLQDENVGIGTSNPESGLQINNTFGLTFQTLSEGEGYPFLINDSEGNLRARWRILTPPAATTLDFDLYEPVNDASLSVRFFRFTTTTGNKEVVFLRGDNSTSRSARIGVDGIDSYFQIHGGNFGLGTGAPATKLHIATGDIYIEDISSGVIMKSPDGNCWRMTVTNSGQPQFIQITCP